MSEHKLREEHDRRFQQRMRVMGIIWATCATLPFFETFLFNAHVASGRARLSTEDYGRIGFFFLLLWCSMCFVFLIEKSHVTKFWSGIKKEIEAWSHRFKTHRSSLVILPVLLLLAYVFVGWREVLEVLRATVVDYVREGLLLLSGGALIWLMAKFVQSLGESLPTGMRDGIENWALSFRVGTLFYVLLLGGTLVWVTFEGVSSAARSTMLLSLIKDYILLFLISGLLYVGLFKLARAKALLDVFQNVRGFIHFVIVCGIIAVFAVWADYRELDPLRLEHLFTNEWQRQYMMVHVVARDVVLLLLPIGWLLFWTLECVAYERKPNEK